MKKFLVLYASTKSAAEQMANATPEQAKAGMDAWTAWASKAGKAVVDLGMPVGNGQNVTQKSASASNSHVSGFSILQADTPNAVKELLKGHPHFMVPGNSIEVLEFLPLPGM
jgi:hypothetical protein